MKPLSYSFTAAENAARLVGAFEVLAVAPFFDFAELPGAAAFVALAGWAALAAFVAVAFFAVVFFAVVFFFVVTLSGVCFFVAAFFFVVAFFVDVFAVVTFFAAAFFVAAFFLVTFFFFAATFFPAAGFLCVPTFFFPDRAGDADLFRPAFFAALGFDAATRVFFAGRTDDFTVFAFFLLDLAAFLAVFPDFACADFLAAIFAPWKGVDRSATYNETRA